MKTKEIVNYLGELVSYRDSLKLYHWHVTGAASYATHMALDQAIDELNDPIDALVETSYAVYGDLEIAIPQTKRPSNIVKHVEDFYETTEKIRDSFKEGFSGGILDGIQQANQQLLYRLKRLK